MHSQRQTNYTFLTSSISCNSVICKKIHHTYAVFILELDYTSTSRFIINYQLLLYILSLILENSLNIHYTETLNLLSVTHSVHNFTFCI